MQAAGAYRGYGATQGIFAVESAVNELAHKMGMDPVKVKEMNMPVEGGPLPGISGCSLCTELFHGPLYGAAPKR